MGVIQCIHCKKQYKTQKEYLNYYDAKQLMFLSPLLSSENMRLLFQHKCQEENKGVNSDGQL